MASQMLSEPIQKELYQIKDFDVVSLPRAYALTLILETRPGKQECLEKPLIQSNSQQSDATSRLGPDLMPPSRLVRADDGMSVQEPETTHVPVAHPPASETIPSDVPVTSVEREDSVQTTSMRRILFKRLPPPLDRVELPKRTRGDDDDHSALLSAYHHGLEKVSEILKGGKSVFSGTGMPDMLDSAWLAIKILAGTPKGETSREDGQTTTCRSESDYYVS